MAERDLAVLVEALKRADAAGDTQAAETIAAQIRQQQQSMPQPAPAHQPARVLPTNVSLPRRIGRGFVGSMENVANLATGIPLQVAGETLATMASFSPRHVMSGAPDKIAQQMQSYAYQPRTEVGKWMQEDIASFMAPVGRGVEALSRAGENPTELGEHAIKLGLSVLPLKTGRATIARPAPTTSTAINTARQWGMAIDPSQVLSSGERLGGVSRRAASVVGGKAAIPAAGSIRNQRIIHDKVAEDLGVKGTITPEVLDNIVAETNSAYSALQSLKNSDGQPYRINLARDGAYKQDLRRLISESTSEVTGEIAARARSALQSYMKPKQGVTIEGTMADVRALRARANREFLSETPDGEVVGTALRGIANAMEGAIERQVGARAQFKPLVDNWRSARQRRAKAETVREAMKDAQIDAAALARARRRGDYLSGNLATIADIAEAMPHMMQSQARLGLTQGLGVPDVAASGLAAGGAGLAAGGPAGIAAAAAWPIGRLGARRYALSDPRVTQRATMPPTTVGAAGVSQSTQFAGMQPGESYGDYVRRREAEIRAQRARR